MGRKKLDISDAERKLRRLAQLRKAHEKRKYLKRLKERVANLTDIQLEQKRKKERVENLTDVQIEQKRKRKRVENLSDIQREQKRKRDRVENLTVIQLEQKRKRERVENLSDIQLQQKRRRQRYIKNTKQKLRLGFPYQPGQYVTYFDSETGVVHGAQSSTLVETDYLIVKEEPCLQNESLVSTTEQKKENSSSSAFIDNIRKDNEKQHKPSDNMMLSNMMKQTNKLTEDITKQMIKRNETKSEFYHFGVFLSCCLEKLDGDLNLEARDGINSILAKFQNVHLNRHQNKQ